MNKKDKRINKAKIDMVLNQCVVFKEQLEKTKKMKLIEIIVWRKVLKLHNHQLHVIFDISYIHPIFVFILSTI